MRKQNINLLVVLLFILVTISFNLDLASARAAGAARFGGKTDAAAAARRGVTGVLDKRTSPAEELSGVAPGTPGL